MKRVSLSDRIFHFINETFWFRITTMAISILIMIGLTVFVLTSYIHEDYVISIFILSLSSFFLVTFAILLIHEIQIFKLKQKVDNYYEAEDVQSLTELVVKNFETWLPIKALGLMGKKAKKAIQIISNKLESSNDPKVRMYCAWTLGEIVDKNTIHALLNSLKSDKDTYVRYNAISSLLKFKRSLKEILPDIYHVLKNNEKWTVRARTASLLAENKIIQAKPILREELLKEKKNKEKFIFAISLLSLEGIYSDALDILQNMWERGNLSSRQKESLTEQLIKLIRDERKKPRTRRKKNGSKLTVELFENKIEQVIIETKLVVMKEMRFLKENEKKIKRRNLLRNISPAIITGIFTIIATLLIILS